MSDILDAKQKLLLEYIITDRVILAKCVRILDPAYFERPLNRVVSFINEYFTKYHSCPSVDAINAETGIQLKEQDIEPHQYEYALEEIEKFCQDAAMTAAVLKSADLIGTDDQSSIPDLMRDALRISIDNSIGTSVFDDPFTRISTMADIVDERPIGIPSLDELVGNIRRGELGVVYAVSSGGKSVMLGNFANLLALQMLDVCIVSLELNEELYSKRLDTILTEFDIQHHADKAQEIANSLGAMKGTMGDITTKKMRSKSTVSDVRNYLTEYHLVKGKYPDVLIVDYLGLMRSTRKDLNKADEQEDIAIGLRDLADEFQMYGFTAGQINREGQDVIKVGPQHVAGGISVINSSDWAIAMTATEEDLDNNQVQVGQLKMRNNTKTAKQITLYRCPKTLKFSDEPFSGKKIGSTPMKTPPIGNKAKPQTSKPKASEVSSSKGKDKLRKAMSIGKRP